MYVCVYIVCIFTHIRTYIHVCVYVLYHVYIYIFKCCMHIIRYTHTDTNTCIELWTKLIPHIFPDDSVFEAGAPSRGKLQGLALQGSTLCFSLRPGPWTLGHLGAGHVRLGKPAALSRGYLLTEMLSSMWALWPIATLAFRPHGCCHTVADFVSARTLLARQ